MDLSTNSLVPFIIDLLFDDYEELPPTSTTGFAFRLLTTLPRNHLPDWFRQFRKTSFGFAKKIEKSVETRTGLI
jgi:hypothetical protein